MRGPRVAEVDRRTFNCRPSMVRAGQLIVKPRHQNDLAGKRLIQEDIEAGTMHLKLVVFRYSL